MVIELESLVVVDVVVLVLLWWAEVGSETVEVPPKLVISSVVTLNFTTTGTETWTWTPSVSQIPMFKVISALAIAKLLAQVAVTLTTLPKAKAVVEFAKATLLTPVGKGVDAEKPVASKT